MQTEPCRVAAKLKELIDENGPGHLRDNPYDAFLELRESGAVDDATACALLHVLVRGAADGVKPGADRASLSDGIRRSCSLRKGMADRIADILLSLYSEANSRQWADMRMSGLATFAAGPFECPWEGFAVWDEGNGTVDCRYRAAISLSPKAPFVVAGKLARMLEENPFMPAEAIRAYFAKDLRSYLDDAFKDYCECDDCYPPVVEDFEVEYLAAEWCRENGFEPVSCEGEGRDGGYEPKFRYGR